MERLERGPTSRYFKDYSPPGPNESYARWAIKVIQKSPVDLEAFTRITGDIRMLSDFPKPKGSRIPDNWLPLHYDCELPHPYMLDRLTPSSIGCAVIPLAERDKKKEPFMDLDSILIEGECLQVDRLDYRDEEICEEILAGFPGISKAREKKIVSDVILQLGDLKHGQRDRRTKDGYPMIGMAILTLELYKKKNSLI
jgi:hypothetical protein